ncbi:MAG: hypothetical protein IPK19_29845 [Chloroflexi bacterium]|nr:hypothetical protein [Chloroflexota bacterium]
MGTLRHEREVADDLEKQRVRNEVEQRRQELQFAEAEAKLRLEAIQRDLVAKRAALEQLEREQVERERMWQTTRSDRLQYRGVDSTPSE